MKGVSQKFPNKIEQQADIKRETRYISMVSQPIDFGRLAAYNQIILLYFCKFYQIRLQVEIKVKLASC